MPTGRSRRMNHSCGATAHARHTALSAYGNPLTTRRAAGATARRTTKAMSLNPMRSRAQAILLRIHAHDHDAHVVAEHAYRPHSITIHVAELCELTREAARA